MSDNNDFKKLWNQQPTSAIPDTKELFKKADDLKRKTKRTLWRTNILLTATGIFIVWVLFTFHPEMWTTKLGVLLVIVSIISFLTVYNRSLLAFSPKSIDKSAKEYLNELIRFKHKQEFMHKTMMNIYFILLTSGILLYMIEYTLRMTFLSGAIVYGVTLLWIAFNWFYIRPRTIRKQQGELNEVIERLEKANNELASNN